jgi:glycosyltransferase involved in cell wall biosynthesis
MSSQTASIISKATQKKDKYNILTFDTHERYQYQQAKTGHNFFSFRYDGCKEWDNNYSELPENYYVMPKNSIMTSIDFDFILSHSKFGQFQAAHSINQRLGLPIVSLEHTLPIDNWPESQLNNFRSMAGNINVFISEYSAGKWNMNCDNRVIHHSVDTELFKIHDTEKNGKVLSVVNDFVNRDYCCNYSGWKRITEGLPVKLVGNTPGLSKPAKDIHELASEYQEASVFLNTSTVSPVPTSLLEAMSCGCAVVSTATCMIPEIIKNGVNGYISNNEQDLRGYTKELLEDPSLAAKMGQAARETILEKFSEDKFINNWNEVFDLAYGMKK